MSSWAAQARREQAEYRRQERQAQKRRKELERQLKEDTRLSLLEKARLEVEQYENAVEVLLSVQKEQSAPVPWEEYATALAPHMPLHAQHHEFLAALIQNVYALAKLPGMDEFELGTARKLDAQDEQTARENHAERSAEIERLKILAKRVLAGEPGAYSEAINEFSSFVDISGLGSSIHITVHSPKLIECVLGVNSREVIPFEMKTLTAAGKLSVKAMPKARFHEIYQNYVCGCVLRLAREMLALLPVETVLITASVIGIDTRTGKVAELPVISGAFDRATLEGLDFEHIDPSDSMENFLHRGDVMASRKSGEFVPITPLTAVELSEACPQRVDFSGLLTGVRQLRAEIGSVLKRGDSAAPNKDAEAPISL